MMRSSVNTGFSANFAQNKTLSPGFIASTGGQEAWQNPKIVV
jgi:hypothetical protein